jgi:hypothetical protein
MAAMMATLTAAVVATIIAAAARGHIAAANVVATAAAAIATAQHPVQELEGIGLRRDTQHARRQDSGNHTTLHGRLLK